MKKIVIDLPSCTSQGLDFRTVMVNLDGMSRGKKRNYHQFCGVARALDFIGERWTLLIVRDLLLGPRRYSDLLTGLPGLTTNLLARRLKDMEEDGLIDKVKLPPPAPARVYRLTALGRELEPLVLAACEWGNRFLTLPTEDELVDLGWSLLRLKKRYRGGQQLIFELHCPDKIYHITLKYDQIIIREGPNPESELKVTGESGAIHQMFFGPAAASDLTARGDIIVQGMFGRWPRLLAAFDLA
jgi:DNA-binding HxlR family transcriptional regulator